MLSTIFVYMFIIIGIMLAGVAVGYLLRTKNLKWIQLLITFFIWLLLFLLGVDVGGNPAIVNNLATLGVEAVYITVGAVLGSAILAWALWHYISKTNKEKKA